MQRFQVIKNCYFGEGCDILSPNSEHGEDGEMLCPHCKKELPDGSKFCQYCGESLLASKNKEGSPYAHEKKKKGTKTGIIVLISVIAFALMLVGTYVGTYCLSKQHAEQGEFRRASQLLVAPFLTKLHDPLLPSYISAGLLYEEGEYEEANERFAELSAEQYLFSSEMKMEIEYQIACGLFAQEKYAEAQEAFEQMAAAHYKDSEEKLAFAKNAIDYYDALAIVESKDRDENKYVASYVKISTLANEGFPLAVSGMNHAKECLYDYAITRYHQGDVEAAFRVFGKIEDYKRSRDYRVLCKGEDYIALSKLIDFENAKDVIINSCPEDFLRGTWKTEDSKYYFTIDQETYCKYNLPSSYSGNSYFGFQDGIYYTYSKDDIKTSLYASIRKVDMDDPTIKKHFQFQIRDIDTVSVYCYADGKTYRLYRQ